MISATFTFSLLSSAVALVGMSGYATAQAPRAAGETVAIQNYASTTGNMHAIIAKEKGLCEKYNFKCEIKTINSTSLGLQALVGKTIDIVQGGSELVGAAVVAGAEVVIVGTSLPANVLAISVRNDVPMPNRNKGYPAIMSDFKGRRIGVAARGTTSEKYFNAMLKDVGLKPEDVTYIAVGAPNTTYMALTVSKQIDAAIIYQPLTQLCQFNKTCETVIDMTIGEGPKALEATIGANVVFVARKEMVEKNPKLMEAFYAAMTDAAAWFNDPKNFDELVKIYTPTISFGDVTGADEMRRSWIKSIIPSYSKDLRVKVSALQEIMDFSLENKIIDVKVDARRVLWNKAPQTP
ncbi:extracellular solute-binding protein [Bradyrhizobiaceae bacterium SG-6C]|nr:extracellular solute-binding protein [Bradyrhizobiaceae bacterium SG-6C]